jgi:hypothetical protein
MRSGLPRRVLGVSPRDESDDSRHQTHPFTPSGNIQNDPSSLQQLPVSYGATAWIRPRAHSVLHFASDYASYRPYYWPDCSSVGNTTQLTNEQSESRNRSPAITLDSPTFPPSLHHLPLRES